MTESLRCPLCDGSEVRATGGTPPLHYCDTCRVAYQWPQPTAEELAAYYDQALDTTYLFKYADVSRARARKHAGFFAQPLPATLFDIGCGTGDYLAMFRDLGWEASGLEISTELTAVAREHHGLDVVSDDFMERSFERQYDAMSAQHVLEHMLDPVAFLEKVHGLLVDNGHMLLAVPNYNSFMNRWVGSRWLFRAEPTHLFHFTADGIRRLADRTGFETVVCTTWQYDMADLLWALKTRMRSGPPSNALTAMPAPGEQPAAAAEQRSPAAGQSGFLRRAAVGGAGLFRPWVGNAGRGSEILAVLRKA